MLHTAAIMGATITGLSQRIQAGKAVAFRTDVEGGLASVTAQSQQE